VTANGNHGNGVALFTSEGADPIMRNPFAFVVTVVMLAATVTSCSSYNTPASPSPAPSSGGTPVSIVRGADTLTTTAYSPSPLAIAAGDTVTWTNNDSTTHTSTSNDGAWNSGAIAPGTSFSRTFPSAGTFQYRCTIHPGMVGTVTVR
jgi:plastocyanin